MDSLQKATEPDTKSRKEFLYGELTYNINGLLIEVYKELGKYSREKQYADLLEKKFIENGIKYKREVIIGDTGNVLDFLVEEKIILELKAKPLLIREHYDQIKRYLYQTNLKLGILVNFRTNYLYPKRVLNESYK